MTYEMMCPKCKETTEVSCKMSDYDNVIPFLSCEKCGEKLKQVLTPPSMLGYCGGLDTDNGKKAAWSN